MIHPIFSIGHGDLPYDFRFIDIIKAHQIKAVADVRSRPEATENKDFGKVRLPVFLKRDNIQYVPLGKELGAQREEWEARRGDKIDFELVSGLPAFKEGLERLIYGSRKMRIVILGEALDPLRCHRGILIGRRLKDAGLIVQHLTHENEIETHDALEKRIIKAAGVQASFFDDVLSESYKKLGDKIAHRRY